MLYKESAIAVTVAVMLVASTLFGGMAQVLATHDPDAQQLSERQILQGEGESVIIDAIEIRALKATSRTIGTLTIEVIQDSKVLASADLDTDALNMMYAPVKVKLDKAVEVEGNFTVIVEYVGSDVVKANSIKIIEGTEVAETEEEEDSTDEETEDEGSPSQPVEEDSIIATKSVSQDDDESTTIEEVMFDARKSTSRDRGTLTVAIVQEGKMIDSKEISSDEIKLNFAKVVTSFDMEVESDFDIVVMYEGGGLVQVRSISIVGETTVADDDDDGEDGTPTDGQTPTDESKATLTVEARDQNGMELAGLWVALLNGNNQLVRTGYTEHDATFSLDVDKSYIVEMGDYYDEDTQTSYEFKGWQDSSNDNTRRSVDPTKFGNDRQETFTAEYEVTENASPPVNNGNGDVTTSPPPDSPPGTVTVYAYRIPSVHWGPTFVSANADMYFVVYNSTGWIVYSGYFDETGHTISGLDDQTYWISPTDCDECHGDPHDVVFDHWEDGSTERQRPVTNGMSVGVYYAYDPDP